MGNRTRGRTEDGSAEGDGYKRKFSDCPRLHDQARGRLLCAEASRRSWLILSQDLHLRRPDVHPKSWRYVLRTTENHIKEEQDWFINRRKREMQQQQQEQQQQQQQNRGQQNDSSERDITQTDERDRKSTRLNSSHVSISY